MVIFFLYICVLPNMKTTLYTSESGKSKGSCITSQNRTATLPVQSTSLTSSPGPQHQADRKNNVCKINLAKWPFGLNCLD